MIQGYEDVNDVEHLKNDPIFNDILQEDLATQPTMSRFDNCFDKKNIFAICYGFFDRYVASLEGRKEIIFESTSKTFFVMKINEKFIPNSFIDFLSINYITLT